MLILEYLLSRVGLLSAADESYHLEPLYACGFVLPVAVLDALTAQAFYMPKAIEVR